MEEESLRNVVQLLLEGLWIAKIQNYIELDYTYNAAITATRQDMNEHFHEFFKEYDRKFCVVNWDQAVIGTESVFLPKEILEKVLDYD